MGSWSNHEIAQVIADEFDLLASDIAPIGEFSHFQKDFEADDLDMMELCAKLEDGFEIKIPPEVEQSWATVQDIYDYMKTA